MDVARAANVSRAAVSKVMRGAYGVSDEMRSRVNKAIEELDYRPLVSARGLRSSTFTLGVAVPSYTNPFFADVVEGAFDGLQETSYQLIMAPTDPGHRDGRRAIEALYDRQVDGILAISTSVGPEWLSRMGRRIPLVQLGRHDDADDYDTVAGDDEGGTRRLMAHLHALGHERIAHVRHLVDDDAVGALTPPAIRAATYAACMREAGLTDRVRWIDAQHEQGVVYGAVTDALSAGHPPSAIFAGNDESALGVLRATADIRPWISVAGYDDSAIAAHPLIDLTSVDQHGVEMGALAMRLLLERIGGRSEARRELLATTLVPRGSTRSQRE